MEIQPPYKSYTPEHVDPKDELDVLIEKLGLIETDALKRIRQHSVEAAISGDMEGADMAALEYQLRAEEHVSNPQPDLYAKGQIALILALANLHKDIGRLELFLTDIDDANEYAYQIGEDEVVATLERLPSAEIARILSTIGEEFGFDDETVAEIANAPYAQAFELAYGYLTQAGLDADEILTPFINDTSK